MNLRSFEIFAALKRRLNLAIDARFARIAAKLEEQRQEIQDLHAALQDVRQTQALSAELAELHRNFSMTGSMLSDIRESCQKLSSTVETTRKIEEFAEKGLHLTSLHYELYARRSGRPYFPLDNGWGLTFLSSGQPFFVQTSDRDISPWIVMGGVWETNVDDMLAAYAGPGMTVLDIGANTGYYTVKIGTLIGPTGRLMAFEPNPDVFSFLRENVKINDLTRNVTLQTSALGNFSGTAILRYRKGEAGGGSLSDQTHAPLEITVPVSRLDDVIPVDWNVDLIKIDTEGYEKFVLDGAQQVLTRSPDASIMIELRMESWEREAPLEKLRDTCGGDHKSIYAVRDDGKLQKLVDSELRPFLITCKRPTGFHENYFFVAPEALVEQKLSRFLV
ncbi:Methyltransferase domain protein [bacterium YEK0313]|nr:Methyltransferase domain protein [bacterium YEK0313]